MKAEWSSSDREQKREPRDKTQYKYKRRAGVCFERAPAERRLKEERSRINRFRKKARARGRVEETGRYQKANRKSGEEERDSAKRGKRREIKPKERGETS